MSLRVPQLFGVLAIPCAVWVGYECKMQATGPFLFAPETELRLLVVSGQLSETSFELRNTGLRPIRVVGLAPC